MWTWNSLVATQTESAAGAPGYGRGWYGLLIALFLCLSSLKAQADTYPAIREYKAWVGSGVAVGYESPVQPDFQSAGKFAWDAWQIPSPDITKIDWFADSNCQGKAEPAFISQSGWVMVWVSYGRAGVGSCSWSYNYVFINLVCPYGGTVVVDQCYNAPPCQAPLTRDPKTGACIQSCQKPDVTDPATGQCVHCTVNPLPQPPFKGDTNPACTASLEKGKGNDVDHKCPSLNPKMTEPNGGQMQCLADKINKLALTPAYTGPSATIRTEAYQEHLRAVWDKQKEIQKKVLTDTDKQACATVIADVTREKDEIHGLDASPSKKGSYAPHVQGIALDIPRDVAKTLMAKLTDTTVIAPVNCFLGICMSIPVHIGDVEDYVNSTILNPPACDLLWGGRFDDKVHFQLKHP